MDSYEKKYKEALGWMQSVYPTMTGAVKEDAEHYFPELKEMDWMIKKSLVDYFGRFKSSDMWNESFSFGDVVSWLEKQGNVNALIQEAYEKAYTEGMRVVSIGARKDVALSIMKYLDRNTLGMCLSNMECADLESAVVDSDWSKVFDYMKKKLGKQGEHKPYGQRKECEDCQFNYAGECKGYCQIKRDEQNIIEALHTEYEKGRADAIAEAAKVEPKFHEGDIIKPKDGGHEPWQIIQVDMSDKKYRFKDGYVVHFSQEDDYELVEQKSAEWSREDEQNLNAVLGYIDDEYLRRWFKDVIHKRYDKPAEWSEEDEISLQNTLVAVKDKYPNGSKAIVPWLETIKDRVQPQPPKKWSEEDEEIFDYLKGLTYSHKDTELAQRAIDWLKSLRPQTNWKPTKEQMDALWKQIAETKKYDERVSEINDLGETI